MVHLLHRRHPTDGRHQSGDQRGAPAPDAVEPIEDPGTRQVAEVPVTPQRRALLEPETEPERRSVMRVPAFSPLAPIGGWLLAWGAITTATVILERANVDTGFNLGIANGGADDDGFLAGLWLLLVSAGAFLAGGYAVARMARANGMKHAALMWVVAMVATAADAIVETIRDGTEGVIAQIDGVPFWAETGMTDGYERTVVLVLFAAAQLAGAFAGGALGQTANRLERSDDVIVHPYTRADAETDADTDSAGETERDDTPIGHDPPFAATGDQDTTTTNPY